MATVFLARLEGVAGFQRLYAIKRLHPHLANEPEFVDMFLDEARLAARIHHPNCVSILEVGTSDRGYYLVMEYIEGDTAARMVARATQVGGRLPIGAAVRIAFDTLLGLHAAHEQTDDDGRPLQIVHRDVSPQNILVGIDGVARITDFGVAHAATRLSSTRTGQLKGKLAYMAPEQAKGAVVDRRADVFAMGVVLWELLAGKRLFKASNDAETLHRILFAPMPTLRGAGIDVPIPLEAVCMRALERDVENRYASAADFADELERVARSLNMLSTTREIATYVDGTMGAEISQQREVVRGWLSRSEPSRHDRMIVPSRGSPGSSSSLPRVSSRDVTITVTPSRPSPTSRSVPPPLPSKRGDVSSVSSAVLELPENTTSDAHVVLPEIPGIPPTLPVVEPAPPPRRRALWTIGGVVLLLGAVGIGFLIPRGAGPVATGATSATIATQGAPVATAPAKAPPSAEPVPTSAVSSATQAVASASATPPATTSAVPNPTGRVPPRRNPRSNTSPPPDDPDDLSRNPYR